MSVTANKLGTVVRAGALVAASLLVDDVVSPDEVQGTPKLQAERDPDRTQTTTIPADVSPQMATAHTASPEMRARLAVVRAEMSARARAARARRGSRIAHLEQLAARGDGRPGRWEELLDDPDA